ncbi:hypothetical protein CICLE_v10029726mg [Citrus x clementina]|uniref:Uncharacterized protein n=1 Tax=Citrus clementina TaxID=85681 RepID=V4S7G4_CITCL|nr:hypothetical protein CICLE_v10029726mg [Citrus x clementina]
MLLAYALWFPVTEALAIIYLKSSISLVTCSRLQLNELNMIGQMQKVFISKGKFYSCCNFLLMSCSHKVSFSKINEIN